MGILFIGLLILSIVALLILLIRDMLWNYHYNRYQKLKKIYTSKGLAILFQEDIRQQMAKEFERLNR